MCCSYAGNQVTTEKDFGSRYRNPFSFQANMNGTPRNADFFFATIKRRNCVTDFFESERFEPIDLCSCFEPIFDPPAEQEAAWAFLEPEPTLENTSFYATDPGGAEYFYCGKTRIKIKEQFTSQGKEMEHLVEDAIQCAARLA